MDKLEALNLMQKLIGRRFSHLDDEYEEAMQFRDWQSCDIISEEREELKELFNFLEKEYRGE